MSNGARIPLAVAQRLTAKLLAALAPACERIEVAGSIRRGKADVGDVELVAIPRIEGRTNILDTALNELLDQEKIFRQPLRPADSPAWGEKYKKFWLVINKRWGLIQIDLFITTPANWGAIFTIRTGPGDFSKALVTHIKSETPYLQDGGGLITKATGEAIPAPTEADYFRLAGVPYIDPPRRTVGELQRVLNMQRAMTQTPGVEFSTPAPSLVHHPIKQHPIKALSLWQPWASFIAAGFKQIETRGWPTDYRGLLAIHAAKRPPEAFALEYLTPEQRELLPDPLPRGAVLCIVRLVDVVPTARLTTQAGFEESQEFSLGDYAPGRWGWKLELVEVFEKPIPAVGQQGLWDWSPPRLPALAVVRQQAQ